MMAPPKSGKQRTYGRVTREWKLVRSAAAPETYWRHSLRRGRKPEACNIFTLTTKCIALGSYPLASLARPSDELRTTKRTGQTGPRST